MNEQTLTLDMPSAYGRREKLHVKVDMLTKEVLFLPKTPLVFHPLNDKGIPQCLYRHEDDVKVDLAEGSLPLEQFSVGAQVKVRHEDQVLDLGTVIAA